MTQLLVVQKASEFSSNWDGEVFILNDEVTHVDDARTNEVLQRLYQIDPGGSYPIPIYRILWTHLAANYPYHGSLLELIPLSERLTERVQEDCVEEIVIRGEVQRKYVPMIEDVAESCGCRVQESTTASPSDQVTAALETTWYLIVQPLLLMVNQLLSVILPKRSDMRRTVAIFPFPGRYDSTMPIARELGEAASCYVPHLGSDLFHWPDIDWNIPLYSYQRHSSLGIIRDELSVSLELLRPRKRREFAGILNRTLNEELGVDLPKTIRYAVDLVIERNARPILYYCWATDFLDTDTVAAVLVGGPAPRDMAILQAAYEHEKDTYYVHHSVVTGNDFLPQSEAVYFVPSEVGAEHIRKIYGDLSLPTLDIVGRPYIDEQYETGNLEDSSSLQDSQEVIVMIATQPYRDEVKEKLVRLIHDAVARSPVIDEVRIKIHPSESVSFYKSLVGDLEGGGQAMSIADSGLEEEVARSSLVVTINSNVGLEAMIQGTPAICYNEWHPSIQNKPYTRSDQIPVFDEAADLTAFFESLAVSDLNDLQRLQTEFAREQFLAGGPATERIAERILSRSLVKRTD